MQLYQTSSQNNTSYSYSRSTDLRASFVFGYTDDVTSTSVEEALLFGLEGQDFITVLNRNPVTSCKLTIHCVSHNYSSLNQIVQNICLYFSRMQWLL